LWAREFFVTRPFFFFAGKGTENAIATIRTYLDDTLKGTQETNSTALADTDVAPQTGMTFRVAAGGVIDGNFKTDSDASLITIDNNKRIMIRRYGY